MSDVALANTPEARTGTGELKNQGTQTPETPPPTTPPSPPAEPEEKKEEKTLLNKGEEGAPTAYEPFKLPEGYEIPEERFKEVGALFKELNLTQSQAQKLVDYQSKMNLDAADAPYKAWDDVQKKWETEVRQDPDMGHRIQEIKTTISKALDGLGDPKLASSFREAMDITGAGNHPAFVKAFWKLAQSVTEGGHVAGGGPSPAGQKAPGQGAPTAAKALYPNLP